MKKFTSKVQRLSQRAAEIRQAIESVPPKIAEVREAVAGATAQVQKLRAEVISSVAKLRAETDTQLIETLREIDGGTEVLAEAGCRLDGVDMDLGPARRLVVRLERLEDVGAAQVRALINTNGHRPAVQALLAAVLKADELAENVDLDRMSVRWLTVDVGLIPVVKIGWRTEVEENADIKSGATIEPPTAETAATSATKADAVATSGAAPMYGGTFFERRTVTVPVAETQTVKVEAALPVEAPREPGGAEESSFAGQTDWRAGALDRFKKMPDLTKRGR